MKEELITFETAKTAKQKGFSWHCEKHYNHEYSYDEPAIFMDDLSPEDLEPFEYSAPTQSLLQKWLREKHGIYVNIDVVPCSGLLVFNYLIRYSKDIGKIKISRHVFGYETYEQALEEGLQEALKLIQ